MITAPLKQFWADAARNTATRNLTQRVLPDESWGVEL